MTVPLCDIFMFQTLGLFKASWGCCGEYILNKHGMIIAGTDGRDQGASTWAMDQVYRQAAQGIKKTVELAASFPKNASRLKELKTDR